MCQHFGAIGSALTGLFDVYDFPEGMILEIATAMGEDKVREWSISYPYNRNIEVRFNTY